MMGSGRIYRTMADLVKDLFRAEKIATEREKECRRTIAEERRKDMISRLARVLSCEAEILA